jgi:hypothetical protein
MTFEVCQRLTALKKKRLYDRVFLSIILILTKLIKLEQTRVTVQWYGDKSTIPQVCE